MLQAGSAISSPAELTTAIKRRPLRQQLAGGCGVSRSSALVNALPKKNHRRASQGMEPLGGARRDGASNRRGPGEPARRSRSPGLSGAQGLGRALRGRVEEPEGVQALPEGLQLPPGMRSTWGVDGDALPGGIAPDQFPRDGSHQRGMLFVRVPIQWLLVYHKLDNL